MRIVPPWRSWVMWGFVAAFIVGGAAYHKAVGAKIGDPFGGLMVAFGAILALGLGMPLALEVLEP